MSELVDRDQEHLRLLKIGYYILAGISAFTSLFSLFFIGMGVVFVSGAVPMGTGSQDDPRLMGLIFLVMGFAFLVFGVLATWLVYYTGRSLAERRRWIFCMVIAVLCCLQVPWGTALGIATIIVLVRPEVKASFQTTGMPSPVPDPATPPAAP